MNFVVLIGVALCLAACYAADPAIVAASSTRDVSGRPVAVAPVGASLSNPAVVTSNGVLAYHRDLESCRAAAREADGAGDDVAALQRALQSKPLQGSITVTYRSGDLAMQRDRFVKQCLSQRGYVIRD